MTKEDIYCMDIHRGNIVVFNHLKCDEYGEPDMANRVAFVADVRIDKHSEKDAELLLVDEYNEMYSTDNGEVDIKDVIIERESSITQLLRYHRIRSIRKQFFEEWERMSKAFE
jgi:hypothetical protein